VEVSTLLVLPQHVSPIKPNDSRNVRIAFTNVPQTWNHQLPDLSVSTVTATTP
jgi:hypothetical protein